MSLTHLTPPNTAAPSLTVAQARSLVELTQRISGVRVAPEKTDFIRMRLAQRMRTIACQDFNTYIRMVQGSAGTAEVPHLVEALTTHTTSFFRENAHFKWLLNSGLPQLVANGSGVARPLAIWSAACSTGAELWSAAMTVETHIARSGRQLRYALIGTDISRKILRRAASATFSESEISGLPEDMRKAFILRARVPASNGTVYRIAPELRRNAKLIHANLLDLDAAPSFRADVVLLRNVLIYFNPTDQASVVEAVTKRISPGGFLLTGHTEALSGAMPGLRPIGPSIYEKV